MLHNHHFYSDTVYNLRVAVDRSATPKSHYSTIGFTSHRPVGVGSQKSAVARYATIEGRNGDHPAARFTERQDPSLTAYP
jgi:hypothetical protein